MTGALLRLLRMRANARGLILVRSVVLEEALNASADEIAAHLERLEVSGVVDVRTGPPFYVIALTGQTWSGSEVDHAENAPKTAAGEARAYSSQSSLSTSVQLKESYRQPSSDEAALLQEILATLGESDPAPFRGAVRRYPPHVIRLALERVRRMKTIRKNPTALFRFLLPRVAKEPPLIP